MTNSTLLRFGMPHETPKHERRWNSQKQRWEYPVVDHIDGNPLNNDPANLRIVWPSDNRKERE